MALRFRRGAVVDPIPRVSRTAILAIPREGPAKNPDERRRAIEARSRAGALRGADRKIREDLR